MYQISGSSALKVTDPRRSVTSKKDLQRTLQTEGKSSVRSTDQAAVKSGWYSPLVLKFYLSLSIENDDRGGDDCHEISTENIASQEFLSKNDEDSKEIKEACEEDRY